MSTQSTTSATVSSYQKKMASAYSHANTFVQNNPQVVVGIIISILIVSLIIYAIVVFTNGSKQSYMKSPVSMNDQMNSSVGDASNPTPIVFDSCGNIIYADKPSDLTVDDHRGTYNVNDYYIYGSYNSCNMSGFVKNNTLSLDALTYVIAQGVRFIDFEIYNLNGEPIIATSTDPTNYYIKESYNYITFSDAMNKLVTNAFSFTSTKNYSDPIFLQLRIKSTDCNMMDRMIDILNMYENFLLDAKYNYTYQTCSVNTDTSACITNNISNLPLYIFQKKIVIIADLTNKDLPECTRFMEMVNMTSYSIYLRILTNYEMINTPDQKELLEFNRRSMTVVTPDLGTTPLNPDSNVSKQLGVQIVASDFSINDQNLADNKNMFLEYAFILKPLVQRYTPTEIVVPPPNPPSYNFSPQTFSVVGGASYNI